MNLSKIKGDLVGHWFFENGTIHKDKTAEFIEWLINNQLKEVAVDKSGWDVLYIDPDDKRYWELVYVESEMQGGGPPSLKQISKESASIKYCLK